MKRPSPSKTREVILPAQLRAQGLADTPEFSPELHARTMAVLRAHGLKPPAIDHAEILRNRWRIGFSISAKLAAAAAIAVAAWFVFQPAPPPPASNTDTDVAFLPSFDPSDLAQSVSDSLDQPAADALQPTQFNAIDSDAQRLALFVADQFPTFGPPDDPPAPQ